MSTASHVAPQPSARVISLSGAVLLTTPILREISVRELKHRLQDLYEVPRFRQRLILNQRDLPDTCIFCETVELQLLTLDYINATDEQIAEVLDASESGAECAVEDILQRPQNPNALYKWYDSDGKLRVISPQELAAQHNDVQLMRLLLSANANVETQASKVTLLEAAEASHTKTDAKAEGN